MPKMHSSVSLTNMITLQEQGSSRLNIAQRAAQDTTSDVVFEGRRPLFQERDETDLSRNRVLRFISFCSTSTILVSVLVEENRRDWIWWTMQKKKKKIISLQNIFANITLLCKAPYHYTSKVVIETWVVYILSTALQIRLS